MTVIKYNTPDHSQRKDNMNGPMDSYFIHGEELEHYRDMPFKKQKDGSYTSWNSMNRGRNHSERSKRGSAERMKTLKKRKGNDAS